VNAALLTACSSPLQAVCVQNRVACISVSKGPKNDAELKCVSARGQRTRSARRKNSKHAHGRVGSWAKEGLQHVKRAANQRSESIKNKQTKETFAERRCTSTSDTTPVPSSFRSTSLSLLRFTNHPCDAILPRLQRSLARMTISCFALPIPSPKFVEGIP
jgi:hypothetical protein